MGSLQVVLPENLELFSVSRKWHDYAMWLVSSVIRWQWQHGREKPDEWSPLAMSYVDSCIPDRVSKELLKQLVQSGALECDNTYYRRTKNEVMRITSDAPNAAVGKCRYYRVGKQYRHADVRHSYVRHPELVRKVTAYRARERAKVTDHVLLALREWSDAIELLPDVPRDNNKLAIVHSLLDGQRWFKTCEQGRVHTAVTSLPRACRPYLRLHGRPMYSCDVSAAQPLLLATVISGQNIASATPHRLRGVTHSTTGGGEALSPHCSDGGLSKYVQDCTSGVLYDRIVSTIPGRPYTRDKVKQKFLAVVYANESRSMGTKVGRAVQQLYPAVFDAVRHGCERLGPGGLPRMMQKRESDIMIHRVAARFVRERPGTPILTVHDCLLTPREDVDFATVIIREEWHAATGITPNVKVTGWVHNEESRAA